MSNNQIQPTQRLMFAHNANYVINNQVHYTKPVNTVVHEQPKQHITNYNQLQHMFNQPIYRQPNVTIKPNVIINPRSSQQPVVIQQRGCNCGK